VQGRPSSTLHGACENGVASICRRGRASAAPVAMNMPIRQMAIRQSMGEPSNTGLVNLMPALVEIKPDCVHIPARSLAVIAREKRVIQYSRDSC
jgi:hypothetical protein